MKKVISLIIVLFISVSSLSLTMTAAKETGDFVCGIWKYSVYPDHVTITGVTTPVSGKIEIPAELDGHKIDYVTINDFKKNDQITEAVIGEGIEYIASSIFTGCKNLKKSLSPQH